MDPNAVWQVLCEALRELAKHPGEDDVRAEAVGLLGALSQWLRTGGFPPAEV